MIFILSLLSGCQSSPTKQYFVLTTSPSQLISGSTALEQDIGIGPVEIPEYLNFTQMVYQLKNGSLQRINNSYWAEPLDQGISRIMSINLSQGDHRRKLVLFPWRIENTPQYSVTIKIMTLNCEGNTARLNANWELIDNRVNHHITQQNFTAITNAETTAAEMVTAYSDLLAQLSQQIDNALQQLTD